MTARPDANTLKPCPFCGGVARLREDCSHSKAYFVGCPTEDCFGELHWGQSKTETVAAWNTRTAPTIPADLLAELKTALHGAAFSLDLAFGSPHKDALLAALARLEKEVG